MQHSAILRRRWRGFVKAAVWSRSPAPTVAPDNPAWTDCLRRCRNVAASSSRRPSTALSLPSTARRIDTRLHRHRQAARRRSDRCFRHLAGHGADVATLLALGHQACPADGCHLPRLLRPLMAISVLRSHERSALLPRAASPTPTRARHQKRVELAYETVGLDAAGRRPAHRCAL